MCVREIFVTRVAISNAIRKLRLFGINAMASAALPLTASRRGCELQSPEASWPAPSRSKRRSGRYPHFQVPTCESGSAWFLESVPEAVQPVEQRMALLAVSCQTFPENAPCIRAVQAAGTRCRATVPVILASTRTSRNTRLCWSPVGLPVYPLLATWHCPGLFGQGAAPCRGMTLRIED